MIHQCFRIFKDKNGFYIILDDNYVKEHNVEIDDYILMNVRKCKKHSKDKEIIKK